MSLSPRAWLAVITQYALLAALLLAVIHGANLAIDWALGQDIPGHAYASSSRAASSPSVQYDWLTLDHPAGNYLQRGQTGAFTATMVQCPSAAIGGCNVAWGADGGLYTYVDKAGACHATIKLSSADAPRSWATVPKDWCAAAVGVPIPKPDPAPTARP